MAKGINPVTRKCLRQQGPAKESKLRKYRARLNWYGQVLEVYTTAMNEKAARNFAATQFAKNLGVLVAAVRYVILAESNKFEIEEVRK
jgi:hypothetical protein